MACRERHHAVIAQSGRPTPDHHIAMPEPYANRSISSLQTSKQKDGWYSKRYGHNRLTKILFVLVLMERHFCARLITVDQAGIGHKLGKSRLGSCRGCEPQKRFRHGRPGRTAHRVAGLVAIAGSIRYPAQRAT